MLRSMLHETTSARNVVEVVKTQLFLVAHSLEGTETCETRRVERVICNPTHKTPGGLAPLLPR